MPRNIPPKPIDTKIETPAQHSRNRNSDDFKYYRKLYKSYKIDVLKFENILFQISREVGMRRDWFLIRGTCIGLNLTLFLLSYFLLKIVSVMKEPHFHKNNCHRFDKTNWNLTKEIWF